jgi:hypothetical protein
VACFSARANDRQHTTITTQFTTTSPSKNHVLHSLFSKPPSKNAHKTAKKRLFRLPKKIFSKKTGLGLRDGLEEQAGWRNS